MERRDFAKKALLGAAGASVLGGCADDNSSASGSGAANVQPNKQVRWKLASSFSRSLDTIYGAAEVLSDRLASLTDGNFQIRTYPGGELVPPLEVLGSVQNGTVEMGH